MSSEIFKTNYSDFNHTAGNTRAWIYETETPVSNKMKQEVGFQNKNRNEQNLSNLTRHVNLKNPVNIFKAVTTTSMHQESYRSADDASEEQTKSRVAAHAPVRERLRTLFLKLPNFAVWNNSLLLEENLKHLMETQRQDVAGLVDT